MVCVGVVGFTSGVNGGILSSKKDSRYSGVGKTTLLSMLLESYTDEYQPVEIGEHNVSSYELAAIIADEIGVGKSSSTKLTEAKTVVNSKTSTSPC